RSMKPGAITSPRPATTSSSGRCGGSPRPTQVMSSPSISTASAPRAPCSTPRSKVLTPRKRPARARRRARSRDRQRPHPAARDHLGTGVDLDRNVDRGAEGRSRVTRDRNLERALTGGAVKRAQDVGGATAGADADDRIPRTDPCAARRVATEIAIVLGGGFVDGVGLDEVGGNAEGGRAFGCVEAGDQAACACAEVM